MKKKTLIFTVNLRGYDDVSPYLFNDGSERILFTDDKDMKVEGWKTKVVKLKSDVLRQTREIKINIHKFVKGFDTYIYVDANFTFRLSLMEYAKSYFRNGLLLHTHRTRDCIFEEAKSVIKLGFDDKDVVTEQMRRYSMAGLKRRYGLFSNGFFIRDNSVNKFMEKWCQEVQKGSSRDQLSLPFCVWLHKPNLSVMQSLLVQRYLKLRPHKSNTRVIIKPKEEPKKEAPRVWYFTPGRGDKNLGRSYNEHCDLVPEDEWICIRDGDTMFLNPYWPKQIEDIILTHGDKFPLISCVTNRLGLENQLPFGFSENSDITYHLNIANRLFASKYLEVDTTKTETAGLFMLFPKKTWNAVKFELGLVNGNVFVDYQFAHAVRTKLGNIGIAQGLYLFHLYRMGKHKRNIEHLK
jgi:hypothetical protein